MPARPRLAAALLVAPLLFAGCASSASHPMNSMNQNQQMTPGMVMPDGSTMGAMAAGDSAAQPSAAAKMICSADTAGSIAAALGLKKVPAGKADWRAPDYVCTYALATGTLVVSVHQSGSAARGTRYIDALRTTLHATPAVGLTEVAYQNGRGDVLLLKDGDVLHVDAHALPATFGTTGQHRDAFAYEIASDILGCWTGDHS